MDDAALGIENAMRSHHGDGGTFGGGQNLRFAVLDIVEGVLGVQVHAEPAGGVHVAHLLVEVQVNFLVDDFQGAAHWHGRTVCLQHLLEAGEYPHAGADGRLCQVHRGDVAGLQLLQSRPQLPAQRVDEVPPGGLGCIRRPLAADQNNG